MWKIVVIVTDMSSNYNNNTQFFLNVMIWLGISLGISLTISLLLPFPISLVVIIGVFILLNLYMRRRMMQIMGMRGGVRGVFSSMSSSPMLEDNSLKYYCMSCGTQHKDISCPNCGSKMKKVGY
jgi:hypothetical protein